MGLSSSNCDFGNVMFTQGAAPGDLVRLGILAAAFSDGTIRIFSIPEPDSLRKHIEEVDPTKATQETLYRTKSCLHGNRINATKARCFL